jgi:plastocyanin
MSSHRGPGRRAGALALAAATAAGLLVGCSNTQSPANRTPATGSGAASIVNGVQQITLRAGDDLRFKPSTFTVHQGKVRIVLINTGSGAPHDFQVSQFPADFVPTTQSGQTQAATFTAPAPGRYRFVCTIHERQGQIGTMIVKAG